MPHTQTLISVTPPRGFQQEWLGTKTDAQGHITLHVTWDALRRVLLDLGISLQKERRKARLEARTESVQKAKVEPKRKRVRYATRDVMPWLEGFLKGNGPKTSANVHESFSNRFGYSTATLYRAAKKLGVKYDDSGVERTWSL